MYVAECPERGTLNQGDTVEEALATLGEATELFLEECPPSRLAERKQGGIGFVDKGLDSVDLVHQIRRISALLVLPTTSQIPLGGAPRNRLKLQKPRSGDHFCPRGQHHEHARCPETALRVR